MLEGHKLGTVARPFFSGKIRILHNVHKLCTLHIGLFLDFGGSNRLDIAYCGSPNCFSTCGTGFSSCMINQVCIMCINCAKKCKIVHIGLFLDFGGSKQLDIAYCSSPNCFSTCGTGFSSCMIN